MSDLQGILSRNWKGGRIINAQGYVKIYNRDHSRSHNNYVREHILVMEKIIGKPLPSETVIHHVNMDRTDNRPANLVLCQDVRYHRLIHRRMRAFKECGHASWLKCRYCLNYDDPKNMYVHPFKSQWFHRKCHSDYESARRRRNK